MKHISQSNGRKVICGAIRLQSNTPVAAPHNSVLLVKLEVYAAKIQRKINGHSCQVCVKAHQKVFPHQGRFAHHLVQRAQIKSAGKLESDSYEIHISKVVFVQAVKFLNIGIEKGMGCAVPLISVFHFTFYIEPCPQSAHFVGIIALQADANGHSLLHFYEISGSIVLWNQNTMLLRWHRIWILLLLYIRCPERHLP